MTGVMRAVYRRPAYMLLGVTSFAISLLFYLWSSQVIAVGAFGVAILPEIPYMAAAVVLATLFGLTFPLQVYAVRVAVSATAATGGTLLGVLAGTASMSCCAPAVLPALLSLLGVSGTSILGLNGLFHRFWLPLATLGIIVLSYSLIASIRALEAGCRLGDMPNGGERLRAAPR